MSKDEFYRLKAIELQARLLQIRQFVNKHNLSIGTFAEFILREFIRDNLPDKFSVAHGFIVDGQQLSHECDIIIYDSNNYAPVFRFQDFVVIESRAVHSVVEVKTQISRKTFDKVLNDFEILNDFGISHKHLFIFQNRRIKSIEHYFYQAKNKYDIHEDIIIGKGHALKYDYGNYHQLPETICSLDGEYCLTKDLIVPELSGEFYGYISYSINGDKSKQLSALQVFLCELLGEENRADQIMTGMDIQGTIPLFPA